MTPHKHAQLIKAWADGAQIEFRDPDSHPAQIWKEISDPSWVDNLEYRVKPQPKKYKADAWLVFNSDGVMKSKWLFPPFPHHVDATDHVVHHILEGELPNG